MIGSATSENRSSRGVRIGLLSLLLFVLLVALVYLAGFLVADDKVPARSTVAGVHIGGLTPDLAEKRLTAQLGSRAQRPLIVSAVQTRSILEPARAGLQLDVEESVAQAGGGRSWSPVRVWRYFTGGSDYQAVVAIDHARLDASLNRLDAQVALTAREGRITFNSRAEPVIQVPRVGRELDRSRTVTTLRQALVSSHRRVTLPLAHVSPTTNAADVRSALKRIASPAVSAPVTLRAGDDDTSMRPKEYAVALAVTARDGSFALSVDEGLLVGKVNERLSQALKPPRDSTVQLVEGRPRVLAGKAGVSIDGKELTGRFAQAATAQGVDRRVVVPTKVAMPSFTTTDARKLKVAEVVSSFTTTYAHAAYRNINIGRAAELVNGTLLRPGEVFSLNGIVGERTAENGFTEGFIISDGIFKEDFGGGVSQAATTLFNAAFFAGLEDIEHKPHSFYIDRYPVGREATVAWGSVDLQFRNNTPYGVLIESWVQPSSASSGVGSMTVRLWSTKYWDIESRTSSRYNFTAPTTRYLTGEDCMPNQGYGGFDIDVYRIFRRLDREEVVQRERMHTTYTPSDSVVCGLPPR